MVRPAAPPRALILLGGLYHDFDGFAGAMRTLFEGQGWSVEATYDLDVLTRLPATHFRMLISYTCLSRNKPDQIRVTPDRLTDAQVNGLAGWVQNGGALLAAHCGTVAGESGPALARLLGGSFVSHPAPLNFSLFPVFDGHPITRGVEAFEVHDELYLQQLSGPVDVHMVAVDGGVAYPMVWSRCEGRGRVAHIAPGHFPQVWALAPYQRLILQAAGWLTEQ
jgi:type 1 glutamine amidotransferase